MNIKEEMLGEVAILNLSGRMMGGDETDEFRMAINQLIHDKKLNKIVIDLGRVKWMNSSAIGILAFGLKAATDAGGDIRLARVGRRIISVFVTMQLQEIFRVMMTC